MRMPQSPPDFLETIQSVGHDWFRRINDTDIVELVSRCNDNYVHWENLRFWSDIPEGLDARLTWAAIALSRRQQYQSLPIRFNDAKLVYWNPPQHLEWLHKIDQQAGGTLGSKSSHSIRDDNEKYLFNSLMEESIASSQLEGAATTRKAAKLMLRKGKKPQSRAERMVLNNYNAILEIRELKHNKLSLDMLKHLQTVLTAGTLDNPSAEGRFRNMDDNVVVEDSRTHETLFTPPPTETVELYLKEICDFANERSKPFIHPVIKAIVLHFALGYVHPFVDGNGRTARALFYWYMLKQGYWMFEYLPISRFFLQAPAKYTRAYLFSETDRGDVTYFIHYNLKVILRAIKALNTYLVEQQRKIAAAAELLRCDPDLNHRQQALIYHALKHLHANYTIQQHKTTWNTSYGTARSDLLNLVTRGYLEMVRGGNKFTFFPHRELLAKIKRTSGSASCTQDSVSEEDTVPNVGVVTRNRVGNKKEYQQRRFPYETK